MRRAAVANERYTDKQLLELAAKAAGFSCWRSKHGYLNLNLPDGTKNTCCHDWHIYNAVDGKKLPEPTLSDALLEHGWNPLDDDGDALRLRNKFSIDLLDEGNCVYAAVGKWEIGHIEVREQYFRDLPSGFVSYDSVNAAVRRAIVLAAAEIGKRMEGGESKSDS